MNSSSCSSGGGGNGGGGGGGNGAMGSKGISMPIGISMPAGICIPISMPTSFASSLLLLSTPSATALGAAVAWAKLFSSSGGGGADGGLGIRAPTIGRGGTDLRGFGPPAEDDTLPPSPPHGGARGGGGLGPLSVIISRGRTAGICAASEHGPDVGATPGA